MSDVTIGTPRPNRGGRKPTPQPPTSASECLTLLSTETVKPSPRPKQLRIYRSLLRNFVAQEEAVREDRKVAALTEQNRIGQEANALRKGDYLLRFISRPLGQQALVKQIERLQRENAELKIALAGKNTEVA
jgi:hypothetical protein